jgi:hypothetical protein
VSLLEVGELDSTSVRPWTPRLWYAYADALLAAGRREEAVRWFGAVATIDEGETDAVERLDALEGPDAFESPDAFEGPDPSGVGAG